MAKSVIKRFGGTNARSVYLRRDTSVKVTINESYGVGGIIYATVNDGKGLLLTYGNGYVNPVHVSEGLSYTSDHGTWRDITIKNATGTDGYLGTIFSDNVTITFTVIN